MKTTMYSKSISFIILLSSLLLISCSSEDDNNAKLQTLQDKYWQRVLFENPTFATTLGDRRYDDKLGQNTTIAYTENVNFRRELLEKLLKIDAEKLSEDNRINYQVLQLILENAIEEFNYRGKFLTITNRSGPHLSLTSLVNRLPFNTVADFQSYISRLEQMPLYIDRDVALMKQGVDLGWSHACVPLTGYEKSIQAHIVEKPKDSAFYKPFKSTTVELSAEMQQQARAHIKAIIGSLKKFNGYFVDDYMQKCTPKVGISQLPNGPEYYQFLVKKFTTTNLTAEQVHQIGKDEVARIRAEMVQVVKQAKEQGLFKQDGTFAEFQSFLRTDPQFYPKTREQRMLAVARISKKMDGLLPQLFTKYPRMPYGIKEIPLDIAEKTTTAYYQPPNGDGTRAGFYFVNTTKLNTRPLYELEALSLHEAVPGHHFQIALAQELDLPLFRRYSGITAFVEGWGLYSERLGLEVGFYDTPFTNFGRLSYEMWRACRLVVDSGMHYLGWSRQQAIDYMLDNSALSKNNIVTEVDRYITWPGQALAYKIGELKIRELRQYAEQTLGDQFDKRQFHDKILENGAIPLQVLDNEIKQWVANQL